LREDKEAKSKPIDSAIGRLESSLSLCTFKEPSRVSVRTPVQRGTTSLLVRIRALSGTRVRNESPTVRNHSDGPWIEWPAAASIIACRPMTRVSPASTPHWLPAPRSRGLMTYASANARKRSLKLLLADKLVAFCHTNRSCFNRVTFHVPASEKSSVNLRSQISSAPGWYPPVLCDPWPLGTVVLSIATTRVPGTLSKTGNLTPG